MLIHIKSIAAFSRSDFTAENGAAVFFKNHRIHRKKSNHSTLALQAISTIFPIKYTSTDVSKHNR